MHGSKVWVVSSKITTLIYRVLIHLILCSGAFLQTRRENSAKKQKTQGESPGPIYSLGAYAPRYLCARAVHTNRSFLVYGNKNQPDEV